MFFHEIQGVFKDSEEVKKIKENSRISRSLRHPVMTSSFLFEVYKILRQEKIYAETFQPKKIWRPSAQ